METERQPEQQAVTAKSRSWHSRQVTQTGSLGTQQTDTFTRSLDKGLLDLLLVVDASGSMQITHEKLKDKLSSLLHDIENSNWQINIIDVDDPQTCDNTIITKNKPDEYANELSRLETKAATNRNTKERTLQKAEAALLGSCNAWLRPASTLAAVIITDEDHQCDPPGIGTNSFQCGTQVSDFINDFRGSREHTGLYGILRTTTTCAETLLDITWHACFNRKDGDKYLANYLDFQNKFDGVINIDSPEYIEILTGIAADIKGKLQNQLTLTSEPDSGAAVTVTVAGTTKQLGTDFEISGRILTLHDKGKPNDSIVVTYFPQDGVKPFISTMSVENQADMSTLSITIAGTKLQKDTHYTVSGHTIELKDVPTNFPTGSVAYLKWQKETQHNPKQKEFNFANKRAIVAGHGHCS